MSNLRNPQLSDIMNITEAQMRKLIDLMVKVAEEVVDDNQSRGSDYQGMGLWRIRENAEKLAEEFNRDS